MTKKKKFPIGIENFEEIITEDFYYVDKTGLITELLDNWGKVNLFTRPRRFGKSLNMSMFRYFFEYGTDKELFSGLKVSEAKEYCDKYMGNFPVISISLKDVNGYDYETALAGMKDVIRREVSRLTFLKSSSALDEDDILRYKNFTTSLYDNDTSEEAVINSLNTLSELLYKHYNQKVFILIDEYDVPLDKAHLYGYYDKMVMLIRGMFSKALKTNEYMYMAILTGCLRISKESIFTGLNNFNILSITSVEFDEYFGFTNNEVKEMLSYYNLDEHFQTAKDWYDGYQFGNVEVYCPWDVINYTKMIYSDPQASPQAFWINSSGNDIVKRLINKAKNSTTKREIEQLIAGESIRKEINMELTYNEVDTSIDNLWSVLFTTGYLTRDRKKDCGGDEYFLKIPNLKVRKIFTKQIYEWFKENACKDGEMLANFCNALKKGETEKVEEIFSKYLKKTISIRDTFIKKDMKENFYHGIILGLFAYKDDWSVASNKESGEGYSDIIIEIENEDIGIILEVKYPDNDDLETGCKAALEQIETRHYDELLIDNGITTILKYGIACYKKRCKVAVKTNYC